MTLSVLSLIPLPESIQEEVRAVDPTVSLVDEALPDEKVGMNGDCRWWYGRSVGASGGGSGMWTRVRRRPPNVRRLA